MATIHASAQYRNVERTIMVHLAGAGLPVVLDTDERFNTADAETFVRVALRPLPESSQGRANDSGTVRKAARASILVAAECYVKGSATGSSTLDAVSELAENVAHRLRYAEMPLKDYVGDGSTIAGCAVQFLSAPSIEHVPPSNGWQRRIVSAVGTWFPRHAE